ncbi:MULTISPECIES: 3-oxo-tetronate kinase [Paracoccus]|uniref:3-oxo-tetronate kinase n=1 Tax=Paracoccus TaxID=265 RepID=UPI000FDBDEAF|nr:MULTISPECIES: 3-oxo-tetronate kinase [Paracoccus]AZY95001.1 four-carbon acid sugar kinase family protein [Paracoccus sp. Arc7-R13]TNB99685.1 four-carbon acid sugar kinase family protein [Paracoccus marcusii]
MKIGVIADDFTGATDIAGFLVAGGLTTTQMIGVPDADAQVDADAVVISLKSRSNPAAEAVADSLAALDWLRARGCAQIYQKYCSTFDSTAEGNIGPVADALMAALGTDITVICPALPVNGRSVYLGHLFVGRDLLQDSGMRDHPITPMRDSSLIRLMEGQAQGRCGLVDAATVDQGPQAVRDRIAALRADGVSYVVLDAISDAHLATLGQAVADMALVTGGSGLSYGIARAVSGGADAQAQDAGAPLAGPAVVISGSCSLMTNRQVAAYRDLAPTLDVDVDRCLADADAYGAALAEWVLAQQQGRAPMITATADPARLRAIQAQHGAAASEAVERTFAAAAARLAQGGITRFIVAGGETSGSVTQALKVTGFAIGPQIAPGVPWVRAVDKPLSLALKSGNFGAETFFTDAQEVPA